MRCYRNSDSPKRSRTAGGRWRQTRRCRPLARSPSLAATTSSLLKTTSILQLCHSFRSFCPFGRSKIADGTHISGTIAGNWEKFSTSNKRTSARPHWSRYRLCAKLKSLFRGPSWWGKAAYRATVYTHRAIVLCAFSARSLILVLVFLVFLVWDMRVL